MSEFEQAFEGLQVNLRLRDLWQQEAVRALRDGEDVVLSAPTGAGKTFVFENLVENDKSFSSQKQAVYTVPTRALANDKWQEWKRAGWRVAIATGDLAENLEAPVIVATRPNANACSCSAEASAIRNISANGYSALAETHASFPLTSGPSRSTRCPSKRSPTKPPENTATSGNVSPSEHYCPIMAHFSFSRHIVKRPKRSPGKWQKRSRRTTPLPWRMAS